MRKIDTIETNSGVALELHGRLMGLWVPLLESLWKSKEGCASGLPFVVDLTDVTAIDGTACYLLRLMAAKNVRLAGGDNGLPKMKTSIKTAAHSACTPHLRSR